MTEMDGESPSALWQGVEGRNLRAATDEAEGLLAGLRSEAASLDRRVDALKRKEALLNETMATLHQQNYTAQELEVREAAVTERLEQVETKLDQLRLLQVQMEVQGQQLRNLRQPRPAVAVARLPAREADDFNGEMEPADTVIQFLKSVVAVCRANGTFDPASKLMMASRHLRSDALVWYERQCRMHPETVNTWERFSRTLSATYCGPDGMDSLMRAFERTTQGPFENVTTYMGRLDSLAVSLGIDLEGVEGTRRFVEGLQKRYMDKVVSKKNKGHRTEALYKRLLMWERYWKAPPRVDKTAGAGAVAASVPPLGDSKQRVMWGAAAEDARYMEGEGYAGEEEYEAYAVPSAEVLWQDNPGASRPTPAQDIRELTELSALQSAQELTRAMYNDHLRQALTLWASRPDQAAKAANGQQLFRATFTCHRCGEGGHFARHCPKAKSCYVCGDAGHTKRDCPHIRAAEGNPKCNYCQLSGHVESGCFRKKRKLPPAPVIDRAEKDKQKAARKHLADSMVTATAPKFAGDTTGAPTYKVFLAAFTRAIEGMSEGERKRFITAFISGFQQDTTNVQDFPSRA